MNRTRCALVAFICGILTPEAALTLYAGDLKSKDPASVAPQSDRGLGFPSRNADLDALPGFQNPPPGYGEVPFWWWTGDPLHAERLIWQLDELHRKGISGVQVNYAHEDSPGWPTYTSEPPIFSDAWWRIWGRVADECRKRGMGIGLSTYTLDWPRTNNLFQQLFYSKPELNPLRLEPLPRQRLTAGQTVTMAVPGDLIAARAHRLSGDRLQGAGVDLTPSIRDGRLAWTAPDGEWELWLVRAERQAGTINPLLAGVGEIVVRDVYQRFQDATPNKSHAGLNYFFNDELHVGAGAHVWNVDFAPEFQKRKGYDLLQFLPALWTDCGATTPKIRMDYADVRMALMEHLKTGPAWPEPDRGAGVQHACQPLRHDSDPVPRRTDVRTAWAGDPAGGNGESRLKPDSGRRFLDKQTGISPQ